MKKKPTLFSPHVNLFAANPMRQTWRFIRTPRALHQSLSSSPLQYETMTKLMDIPLGNSGDEAGRNTTGSFSLLMRGLRAVNLLFSSLFLLVVAP